MSDRHVNCGGCGELVKLTKAGQLARHGQKRDGRRVVSVCPMSGVTIDGAGRNHGRLGEILEWDRRIADAVDEFLDGGDNR